MKNSFLLAVLAFCAFLVLMWLLSSDAPSEAPQQVITVDCSNSINSNNPICSGEVQDEFQEQDYVSDSYYQNLGH